MLAQSRPAFIHLTEEEASNLILSLITQAVTTSWIVEELRDFVTAWEIGEGWVPREFVEHLKSLQEVT